MTDERTIFHKIITREAPADIVYEDDEVIAFRDIAPKAATHLLFVPKLFAPSVVALDEKTQHLPGLLILKARSFALENGIDGYKIVFHVGKLGGQEVFYIHLHFLAQQKLEKKS